jgi:hypothetical protein
MIACGGGGDEVTAPLEPLPVFRVEVDPDRVDNFRPGMTAQLIATPFDVEGNIVTGRPVAWRTSSPDIATVSSNGLVTAVQGSGFGNGFTLIEAEIDGVTETATFWFDAWSFIQRSDPVNGNQITEVIRKDLNFRCTAGHLEAYVRTSGVTASGGVEYRLDNRPARSELWHESTNFRALFYPGDVHVLAQEVAASDSLIFRYSLFTGGSPIVRIDLFHGLAAYLPRLFAACP